MYTGLADSSTIPKVGISCLRPRNVVDGRDTVAAGHGLIVRVRVYTVHRQGRGHSSSDGI